MCFRGMGVINFIAGVIRVLKREKKALSGDLGKDRLYYSSVKYGDTAEAAKGFGIAV